MFLVWGGAIPRYEATGPQGKMPSSRLVTQKTPVNTLLDLYPNRVEA